MKTYHAVCVAFGSAGVLIRGVPGSGKSTLALQLIEAPGFGLGTKLLQARLVSDDQVELKNVKGKIIASAPSALAGLVEVRGLGLLSVGFKKSVTVKCVVDLVPATQVERLPHSADQTTDIEGVTLPRFSIAIANPAAAAILRSALHNLT